MDHPADVLLAWYREHARDLPWRRTKDPWAILVAEVVLQQTRVEQARPYYERILARFPTPRALAEAPLEALLHLWQGLGYYRRAERLWQAAKAIAEEGFPTRYEALVRLPGLGPYTAGAVAAIAFGEPVPAVDGNVRRVLARYFAEEDPKPEALRRHVQAWLPEDAPGDFNQALIELGATLCTPRHPECARCPLAEGCRGRAEPERYPRPRRRRPKRLRLFALVLKGRGGWVLERREEGPFQGLWGVPLGTSAEALARRFGVKAPTPLGVLRHELTHRRLEVTVLYAPVDVEGEPRGRRPLSRLDERILALVEERLGEG